MYCHYRWCYSSKRFERIEFGLFGELTGSGFLYCNNNCLFNCALLDVSYSLVVKSITLTIVGLTTSLAFELCSSQKLNSTATGQLHDLNI